MTPCPATSNDQTLRQRVASRARTIGNLRRGADGWQYRSVEALVLAHGRFVNVSLTTAITYPRGRQRECFRNACLLAESAGAVYVEGYALAQIDDGAFHVAHAWCIDSDGALLEPTWLQPGVAYLGVPLRLSFVKETILRRNRYGVLDAYDLGWPLLRDGLPNEARIEYA